MLASKLVIVIVFSLFYIGQVRTENLIRINPFIVTETGSSDGTCPSIEQRAAAHQNITSVVQTLLSEYVCEHIDTRCLDMNCGPGEWRQVAYLNMSDPSQQCPSAWREYNTSEVRACGRPATSVGSCAGVSYSNNNEQYSRVCGRAIGYQFGGTDAFAFAADSLESYYVYGVSFTHGSPRTHIWTLAADITQNSGGHAWGNCPCAITPGPATPSFVGSN